MTGTYSPYIYEISDWLQRNGVRVYIDTGSNDHKSGSYNHEARFDDGTVGPHIAIFDSEARGALLTIAHEAGHWLGYLIGRKPRSYQRERQAYVYGWHVLRWFGAPISRAEWRESCREDAEYKRHWDPEFTLR